MHWLFWVLIAIFVTAVIIAVVLAVPLLPIPKFSADPQAAQRYAEIAEYGREVSIPIPARGHCPKFHVHGVEMGSIHPTAPLMVFIHGFPETGITCWSRQLKYFSNIGILHLLITSLLSCHYYSEPIYSIWLYRISSSSS
jgi:hypothetical protein